MKSTITNIIICASLIMLSGCAITGKYEVDMQQADELGFSKKEMIELGQLVNIAYELFNGGKKPQNPNPEFPADFVPGYTPIRNLQGVDNIHRKTKEFYGHLSWLDADPGTLVISIRGTSDAQEWIDDAKFELVDYSDNKEYGCVELGFKEIFSSFTVSKPGGEYSPLDEFLQSEAGIKKIIVVGHSLGSSLATLVAFDADVSGYAEQVQLLTFASPLTGNAKFVKAFQARIKDSVRIVNHPDIVPRVPPEIFGYRHVWHELEINSKDNPGIKHSILCYHSLLTYLHVLDEEIPLAGNCAKEL